MSPLLFRFAQLFLFASWLWLDRCTKCNARPAKIPDTFFVFRQKKVLPASTRFLWWKSSCPKEKTRTNFWGSPVAKPRKKERLRPNLRETLQKIVEGTVRPGPRFLQHCLYWVTAFSALRNVVNNDYPNDIHNHRNPVLPAVYSRLFYFARLRPRLLYAVGALLRALQLCTPFRNVLDPSAGVGAGVNVCASIAGSRWVKPVILGWATTKWTWVWLGAKKLDGAHLPITLSVR